MLYVVFCIAYSVIGLSLFFCYRLFFILWFLFEEFPLPIGCIILLWHSVFLPYNHFTLIIIIIIIKKMIKGDIVFSMTSNLPYGPPMNTDTDQYRTFLFVRTSLVCVAMLVVRYLLEEEPVLALSRDAT